MYYTLVIDEDLYLNLTEVELSEILKNEGVSDPDVECVIIGSKTEMFEKFVKVDFSLVDEPSID